MNLRINRRMFATSAALTAPFVLTSTTTHAQQMEATPATPLATAAVSGIVGIGSSMEEWTNAAGEPTPVGDAGNQFLYISPIDGVTEVIVGFTDDIATFMEYTYGEAGPTQSDAHAIVAASLPTQAMPGELFLLTAQAEESSTYTAQIYTVPETPNDAIVSVMALGAMEAEEASVVSISLGLATTTDTPIEVTGEPGGIGLGRDEWIATYGEPPEANYEVEAYPGVGPDGMDVTVTYLPQDDVIRWINVDSAPDAAIATTHENANAFVGSSVPPDATAAQYFYLPATENGPIALEFTLITSQMVEEQTSRKGNILAMLALTAGDTGAGVQRIDVVINNE